MGQCVATKLLFPTCTSTRSIATLSMQSSLITPLLRSKLIQALTAWQGHGGVMILSSVDQLAPDALQWLLGTLTGVMDNHDEPWLASLASRVMFLLTSDEIGRPSLIHHRRTGESFSTASLLLDLRHEWQRHGAQRDQASTATTAVLPFFAIESEQFASVCHSETHCRQIDGAGPG